MKFEKVAQRRIVRYVCMYRYLCIYVYVGFCDDVSCCQSKTHACSIPFVHCSWK